MVEEFGRTADGDPVYRVRIEGGGLSASFLSAGAAIQDLRIGGHPRSLVLGFDRLEPYLQLPTYMGAIVGRFANRIAGGRFEIDGKPCQADTDFLGKHTLHGGSRGIDKRLWTVADHGADFVTLTYASPDGEMGFPGQLDITCTYRLPGDGRMTLDLAAVADAPTLCNLSQHGYFNLDDGGASPVLDHHLQIAADAYLPVNNELIPTGEVRPVKESRFDFRASRPIRNGDGAAHQFYDHNFCLSDTPQPIRPVATARGAKSGVEMRIDTNQPGLQFFDGAPVSITTPGLDGVDYRPYCGFCLEPQGWPDSPHHPGFPQSVLRPDETYRHRTEYRISHLA